MPALYIHTMMSDLETKDTVSMLVWGIMMLIWGIVIHFLVIVWYEYNLHEDMLFGGRISRALVLATKDNFTGG